MIYYHNYFVIVCLPVCLCVCVCIILLPSSLIVSLSNSHSPSVCLRSSLPPYLLFIYLSSSLLFHFLSFFFSLSPSLPPFPSFFLFLFPFFFFPAGNLHPDGLILGTGTAGGLLKIWDIRCVLQLEVHLEFELGLGLGFWVDIHPREKREINNQSGKFLKWRGECYGNSNFPKKIIDFDYLNFQFYFF